MIITESTVKQAFADVWSAMTQEAEHPIDSMVRAAFEALAESHAVDVPDLVREVNGLWKSGHDQACKHPDTPEHMTQQMLQCADFTRDFVFAIAVTVGAQLARTEMSAMFEQGSSEIEALLTAPEDTDGKG